MSSELDLVQAYMDGGDVPASELLSARAILGEAIDSEIRLGTTARASAVPSTGRRRWSRPARWSFAVAAAAAAIAVLIFQALPMSTTHNTVAAAAQISRLADAVQPAPPLQAGQWSDYQMQGVLSAVVGGVGNVPTPNARASVPITLEVWSNATGGTCTTQQFGSASFASPINAQAWHAIGLIDTPNNQPVTGCAGGVETSNAAGSALAAIDVSALTHDPATLVTQLQTGTTGIPPIDQAAAGDPAHLAGFMRLTLLLVGPITGGWSGFGQEMLRSMSLLPQVVSLGTTTAHSGHTGLAFSSGQQSILNPKTGAVVPVPPGPTVVLDPQSGALLEARNFDVPILQSAAQDFVGSPTAPVYTQGAGYGVSADWIDPVAPPGVVEQAALPGWISTFHIVEAVTKPTTTSQQVSDLINPSLGNGDSAAADDGTPGPGLTTYDVTIMGTTAHEDSVVAAMTASDLFSSVSVKM